MGDPLVLMDGYGIVNEKGVGCHSCKSDEVTRREVIDDGSSLVEEHVELHSPGMLALVVDGQLVAVIDDKSGKQGEIEKPFPAEDKVVAVAASDADMAHIDADIMVFRILLFPLVARLDASTLIAQARKPRPCRPTLDVALVVGCGNGVAAMVEDIVSRDVEDLHVRLALLHSECLVLECHVTRQGAGFLIAGIDAETTCIEIEVQLVVVVEAPQLGGIDGIGSGEPTIGSGYGDGRLVTGAQM